MTINRKLASIKTIAEINPIPGADRICHYRVDYWWVIDGVGKYKVGDKVIYCEIDSFLPVRPEYEFLRKSSHKQLTDGREGFRLRTIKLKGAISQGLLLPLTSEGVEGDDLTESLGITKWDPPVSAQLSGLVKGNFPNFFPKTDEERVQNIKLDFSKYEFQITEKLDGSSFSAYCLNGEYGVCSRNMELKETEDNAYWKASRSQNVKEKLLKYCTDHNRNIAIQGELLGPGVQGNSYKLPEFKIYFFNAYDIDKQVRFSPAELSALIFELGLPIAPVINARCRVPEEDSVKCLLDWANGKSMLNPETDMEGFVVRDVNGFLSFKVISNNYLMKQA